MKPIEYKVGGKINAQFPKGFNRRAWTGGDFPTKGWLNKTPDFRRLTIWFFRDQIKDCISLDYWACAGTSSLQRARIFWNRAKLDSFRTLNP